MPMQPLKWKVLLIDEDEAHREATSSMLREWGYRFVTASSGAEGLKACQLESPEIVLLEIQLPDMDGIELLASLKKSYPGHEVIILTDQGAVENILQAFRLEAADFITKPVTPSELQASLERAKKRYFGQKKLEEYTALMEEKWLNTSEELAKTFQFQKRLIESSIDGIIGCDYDRKIIVFNKSMERMLGYSKDMVIGKMFLHHLFSPEGLDKFQDQLYSDALGGEDKLYLSESTLISRTGERIPVRLSAQVLFQGDEEIGVVAFFRDLRTVKRLKQQFLDQAKYLHQDKMVSLGKLAASVVHEINNPLTGVLNYISLMSKILGRKALGPEQVEKFKRYLDLMGSEVKRSSDIVSNLLAFSRKSKLEFSDVAVHTLLERSVLLSHHKLELQNIRVLMDFPSESPVVLGDFNQLQQCILNLIFNAADAMPEGGTLTIACSVNPGTRCAEIRVQDTGRGIAPEHLPKIFDPFFSTKQEGKGLGLGLSVVYGIIDRHKGSITAESEPGKGTVFTIQLPLKADIT